MGSVVGALAGADDGLARGGVGRLGDAVAAGTGFGRVEVAVGCGAGSVGGTAAEPPAASPAAGGRGAGAGGGVWVVPRLATAIPSLGWRSRLAPYPTSSAISTVAIHSRVESSSSQRRLGSSTDGISTKPPGVTVAAGPLSVASSGKCWSSSW